METYKEILAKNNQEHLLTYIENANEEQRKKLINQIENIDFEKLNKLYKISTEQKLISENKIEHINYTDKYKLSKNEYERLANIGKNTIENNQYAVVTMAGGQGTRLGHKGPKGTFLLNVSPKPMYLFEILATNLIKENKKYNVVLNWYIMTSTENDKQTEEFFKEHNYFNYPKENIKFFKQGNLPLIREDGKLIVDENYNIKYAADGNGCIYKAMREDCILQDMKSKGIKWIFIGSVDNALLNMVDPVLLGLTVNDGNKIGSKSIVKNSPHEKVGVFCKKNNVPTVIEYSELPEDMAEKTDDKGELLFGESHIMCNLYSIDALELISTKTLPYHSAHKKANYLMENGEIFEAKEPNAYKYEAFIFDGFNYFDEISILRGKREVDFAPIKNATGNDSPETAIKLYNNFHNCN